MERLFKIVRKGYTVIMGKESVEKIKKKASLPALLRGNHPLRLGIVASVSASSFVLGMSLMDTLAFWPAITVSLAAVFTCAFMILTNPRSIKPAKNHKKIDFKRQTIVLELLKNSSNPLSYEEIKKQTGFFDKVLVPVMKDLVTQEMIEEELDMETGIWHYSLSSGYWQNLHSSGAQMDLDARLKNIER